MFSFSARKKALSGQTYLRRICDLTVPNFVAPEDDERSGSRYNRAIPTLICPWAEEDLPVEDCFFGMTKDISDRGFGVVLNRPCQLQNLILGFWLPDKDTHEPWYFHGRTTRSERIGGGFWLLGVEVTEYLSDSHRQQLDALAGLAQQLLATPSRVS